MDELENYDWIGEMTWLQGVTLGKCSNLNFTASLEDLRFINVTYDGKKEEAKELLHKNNKKCKWICLE